MLFSTFTTIRTGEFFCDNQLPLLMIVERGWSGVPYQHALYKESLALTL